LRGNLSGALKRESVKKNVAAIHVSGKLSLLQRKLSNVLLLNAYDTLVSQPKHRIDARTLCLMIGYNSNDMDTLKQALRGLAETVAEWDMLDDKGRQEWGVSALLSYAKLKGGVCEYAYSPALAEKLHDPKVFALINLNIQRRFTSGHALALYENCYRFVRTGSTGWWPLDLFRRLMGVDDSVYYETFQASERQDHQTGGGRGEQDVEYHPDAATAQRGAGGDRDQVSDQGEPATGDVRDRRQRGRAQPVRSTAR
jgi:hypothetical protein